MDDSNNFETANVALSATLLVCGVPHPKDDAGLLMPARNVYDVETLKKLATDEENRTGGKSCLRGLSLLAGARRAWQKRWTGRTSWLWQKGAKLDQVRELFDKCNTAIAENSEANKDRVESQPMVTVAAELSEIVMVACLIQKARAGLHAAALSVVPTIARVGAAQHSNDGNKKTIQTTLQMCSINASAEIRAKLGF